MLCIMHAYLLLFAALTNTEVYIMLFLPLILANAFCFMLCPGLLTHKLFISSMIFHHAQWL